MAHRDIDVAAGTARDKTMEATTIIRTDLLAAISGRQTVDQTASVALEALEDREVPADREALGVRGGQVVRVDRRQTRFG
jgi:hypothetical protein